MNLKELLNLTGNESGAEVRKRLKEEIKLRRYFNKCIQSALFTRWERVKLWFMGFRL